MTGRNRISVTLFVFYSNVVKAFHDGISTFIAKAFNSAVARSINSELACEEVPVNADLRSMLVQILISICTMLVVLQFWISSTISQRGEFSHSIKYMSGEIVAWSFKEMTATILVLLATGINGKKLDSESERQLGDLLQGDGEFHPDEVWLHVAAYGIYFGILSVVILIIYHCAFRQLEAAFWGVANLFYRAPCSPKKKITAAEQVEGIENDTLFNHPFSREESDDMAFEFVTECIRLSFAWCSNGYISGILVAIFTSKTGETNQLGVTSFGFLEIYCIIVAAFGGLVFGQAHSENESFERSKLAAFCVEWWSTWAGLAIASLATSPGAISARVEDYLVHETLSDLVRALMSTLFAVLLLFHGSNVRARRKIFCMPISDDIGKGYSNIMITAAIIGVAIAWEEFAKDLSCTFVEVEVESNVGISAVEAVWMYFLLVLITLFPLSIFIGKKRRKIVDKAENLLQTFIQKDNVKENGNVEEDL